MKKRLMSGVLAAGILLLNLSEVAVAANDNTHQKDIGIDIYSDIDVNDTFTDEIFRNWILDKNNLNGIGEDGILSYDERVLIKSIDVSGKNISDLKGIEVFMNLEELDCSRNTLSSLDLSGNTLLKTLNCSNNQLTELSLVNQSELTSLSCNYNRLTSLDVSNKQKLRALSCEYNYIENLNIAGNTSLEWINVRTNLLTGLDTTDNVKLKVIEAFDNKLATINISTLSDLEFLNVASNKLTELDLSNNTNLSVAGGGFAASNNLLEKIILPNQPQLKIELSAFQEQDPVLGYDRVKWFEDEDLSVELSDTVTAQGQCSRRMLNMIRNLHLMKIHLQEPVIHLKVGIQCLMAAVQHTRMQITYRTCPVKTMVEELLYMLSGNLLNIQSDLMQILKKLKEVWKINQRFIIQILH